MLNDLTLPEKGFGEIAAKFLEKFPSRWDWIYAETITESGKAAWRTINSRIWRFAEKNGLPLELTDEKLLELWRSPLHLIGVGFGKTTEYLMLDIDKDSPYHPHQSDKLREIQGELEEIGLVRSIAIQSSYSEGIHLYYPLAQPVKSYALARTITDYLNAAGYEVANGKLEVFPNKKALGDKKDRKTWTQYQRHRLPLQQGSYILDRDYQPYSEDLGEFMRRWEVCASCQDHEALSEALKLKYYVTVTSSSQGLEPLRIDYQKLLAKGFTGDAQSNDILIILGRLTRILEGLGGTALRDRLITLMKGLPGYEQYCDHKRDLRQRCQDVARWAEKKFFVPSHQAKPSEPLPLPGKNNDEKKLDAIQRIQGALAQIKDEVFQYKTDFLKRIVKIAQCSMSTLVKHWQKLLEPLFRKQHSPLNQNNTSEPKIVCNSLPSKASSDFEAEKADEQTVCNPLSDKHSSHFESSAYTKGGQSPIPLVENEGSESHIRELLKEQNKKNQKISIKSLVNRLRQWQQQSSENISKTNHKNPAAVEEKDISGAYRTERRLIPQWLSEFFLHRKHWHLYGTAPPETGSSQQWVLMNYPPHGTPPEKLTLVEVDVPVPE